MQLQDLTTREFPLERIGRDKVPIERRWQINAVWDLEFQHVKRWLEHQARFRTTNTDHGQNAQALSVGPALSDEVAAIFAASPAAVDPVVIRAAHLGELQKAAPSLKSLTVMRIIKLAAAAFETIAFMQATGWQSLSGNYILLILGPLLALLAWLSGYGAARILMAREQNTTDAKGRLAFIVGSAGIILAVAARFVVGSSVGTVNKTEILGATLLPVLLALAIATLEAIEFPQRRLYEGLHAAMFESQSWFATQKHAIALKDRLYVSMFASILNRISLTSLPAEEKESSSSAAPDFSAPPENVATESTVVPPAAATGSSRPKFSARLTLKEERPNHYEVVPQVVDSPSDQELPKGDE
jgi:hypothetical protein